MEEDTGKMKRREFLAGLGAAATIGSALSQIGPRAEAQAPAPPTMVPSPDPPSAMVPVNWQGPAAPAAPDEVVPALQRNPNILVILVDQMRQPQWLTAQFATYTASFIPNIWSIHNRAVNLQPVLWCGHRLHPGPLLPDDGPLRPADCHVRHVPG